ncbi:MAG: hypothetical protein GQ535_04590 [Rhodobacteraceae bacterium]|nr:hypothetical protein [Paracoccaceae bacterium]
MSKHYSSDNECILTGGLWALIAAGVIGLISWIFVDFWPTAIVVFAVVLLAGLIIAFFMCKARTVARGGVDIRAIDLARAEMGIAAPDNAADVAEAEDEAAAEIAAAKAEAEAATAKAKAEAEAKADAAKAKAAADKNAKAAKAKAAKAKAAEAEPAHVAETGEAKPALLTEARGGKADDLKKIKGVGPKLEKELNAAGVFHFDQIASWSAEEVHWADHHLVSFKGRVSRDSWVDQAKELAK